ncbi:hypothetical protein XELAEV_18042221mg [Xenopus laevis]|uniref:Uncharacterized protein n=1 Tax=Xenopus laevis TaxID=8355 RepID=A0A974C3S8_XENLA|nr:hypothetical protein XELAEV_18042221mg [Xenopus laevis]
MEFVGGHSLPLFPAAYLLKHSSIACPEASTGNKCHLRIILPWNIAVHPFLLNHNCFHLPLSEAVTTTITRSIYRTAGFTQFLSARFHKRRISSLAAVIYNYQV